MLKKGKTMCLSRFAKLLNYPRASNREFKRILQFLEKEGLIVVQQGGFVGDSMHHPKIVAILKPLELDAFSNVVLTRTNFTIGDFTVHKTKEKRKCEKCKHVIEFGARYGVKIQLGRKRKGAKRRIVFAQNVVCLPCLLEEAGIEGLETEVY
jgi:hypothetical protein